VSTEIVTTSMALGNNRTNKEISSITDSIITTTAAGIITITTTTITGAVVGVVATTTVEITGGEEGEAIVQMMTMIMAVEDADEAEVLPGVGVDHEVAAIATHQEIVEGDLPRERDQLQEKDLRLLHRN